VYGATAVGWAAAIVTGRMPRVLHDFGASYLRYFTHVCAYILLLEHRWPRFSRRIDDPVGVDLAGPESQRRATVGFRLALALPALVFASVLATVLVFLAVLGWFLALAIGRIPAGMEELGTYCLGYVAQAYAYALLLTPRHPTLAAGVTTER